ncbi:MAG: hypothetical protein R8P61_25135 [Bacteroidia bacterium]|nr:hypothetical protein [Bacteroidia bacterium]
MDELLRRLQETNRKAIKLERLILRMKEEKDKLRNNFDALKTEMASRDVELNDMQEKYEAVKLAKQISPDTDRKAVQEKIDLYIKEIDACLKRFGE